MEITISLFVRSVGGGQQREEEDGRGGAGNRIFPFFHQKPRQLLLFSQEVGREKSTVGRPGRRRGQRSGFPGGDARRRNDTQEEEEEKETEKKADRGNGSQTPVHV